MIPKREIWVERILTGLSAVVGLLAFVGALYGGAILLWLFMNAPEAMALVASAAIIGAAICLRKPPKVFNLALGHPETEEILRKMRAILDERKP